MVVPPAADHRTDPHRSPVGGGSRRPAVLVVIAVAAVVTVAVLKPWGSSPVPVSAATTSATPSGAPSTAALPTPPASSPEAHRATAASLVGPSGVVRRGVLEPGRYDYRDVDGRPFDVSFTIPPGWAWDGTALGTVRRSDGAVIRFFTGDVQVYVDPCHWRDPVHGPWGSDLSSLIAALAAPRRSRASVPIERLAPALDSGRGWPGMAIELTVPPDLRLSACDAGEFRYWVYEPERLGQVRRVALAAPGQSDYVWALQIQSERLIVDAVTVPGTSEQVRSEVMAILRSIAVRSPTRGSAAPDASPRVATPGSPSPP